MKSQTQGKIFVIDGPDGVGKATTVQLATELCIKSGLFTEETLQTISFPQYDDFFGKLVRHYLSGDQADKLLRFPKELRDDPLIISPFYAMDRYLASKRLLWPELKKGNSFIIDRYVTANLAHQGLKVVNPSQKRILRKKLFSLEFEYFGIPQPDLVIVLDLPEEIRRKRTEYRRLEATKSGVLNSGKVAKIDIHEQDFLHMSLAAQEYRNLAKSYGWTVINCVENNRELTPRQIANKVREIIARHCQ